MEGQFFTFHQFPGIESSSLHVLPPSSMRFSGPAVTMRPDAKHLRCGRVPLIYLLRTWGDDDLTLRILEKIDDGRRCRLEITTEEIDENGEGGAEMAHEVGVVEVTSAAK